MPIHYSPLRYPGGKHRMISFITETLRINSLNDGIYVEPFAGGAAIAWHLLIEEYVNRVYINDLSPSIFSFWHSILFQTEKFCKQIETTTITIDEWYKQREVYRSKNSSMLALGFATFFLNRTNRSGIINGGVIGGVSQNGNYKLDCRFNKARLILQIRHIAERRDKIHLSNLDAVDFISEILPSLDSKCLVNIDPPYYVKGKKLYQNYFEHSDHIRLCEVIKGITQPWIVTYDDTPEIHEIYGEYAPAAFRLTYSAQKKRKGAEVIIHSPSIIQCTYKPDITSKELMRLRGLEQQVNISSLKLSS